MRYPRCGWDAVTAMNASTLTSPLARGESDRPPRRSGSTPKRVGTVEVSAERSRPLELDTAGSHWQLALDRAQRALSAAGGLLPAPELERRLRGRSNKVVELRAH